VRAVPATGEFLMISNRASDPAAALEVCKAFLEPQVQKLIAEYKFGLPVLKSLIPDTMDTRRYRDDIFVSEMKDLLVNNALDQDVNLSLVALMYGLLENAFNFEEFLDQAERLFQMHYNMRSAEDRIHSQLSWSY
jgi:ABC-type glycerol-3-phosphate transport system substrate-binding protein